MGMGMPFIGAGELIIVLVLGLGYIVLYFANKEKGGMKITGFIIGILIIVLSVIALISGLAMKMNMSKKMNFMRGMQGMPGAMRNSQLTPFKPAPLDSGKSSAQQQK